MQKLDAKSVKNVVGGNSTCSSWNPITNRNGPYSPREQRYCSPADKHGRYTGGEGWMEYR